MPPTALKGNLPSNQKAKPEETKVSQPANTSTAQGPARILSTPPQQTKPATTGTATQAKVITNTPTATAISKATNPVKDDDVVEIENSNYWYALALRFTYEIIAASKASKLRTEEKKPQTFTTESLTKKPDFISTIQSSIQKDKGDVIEIEKPAVTQKEAVSKANETAQKKEETKNVTETKIAPETKKTEPAIETTTQPLPSETVAMKEEKKVNGEHKPVALEEEKSEKAISMNFSNDADDIVTGKLDVPLSTF